MNRKSFLKTVFTGLIATKLAFDLGAKTFSDSWRYVRSKEEIDALFLKEAEKLGPQIAWAFRNASVADLPFGALSEVEEPWSSDFPLPLKFS